ncbi:hypothetical protein ANCCAN_16285 [Ancylostoma caninum]|uniref:Uncharacterized protein n=1 Tax=Ancylostoma caninum TaxID=29170 RepID=A0A368G293_ANCCA|nr:hypothetical protein ANCCAN_16285 [Ancylostoma caninum]
MSGWRINRCPIRDDTCAPAKKIGLRAYSEQFEKTVRTGNASQQTAEPHGSNSVENVVDHASGEMCGHTNMRKTPPLKFLGGYLMTARPKNTVWSAAKEARTRRNSSMSKGRPTSEVDDEPRFFPLRLKMRNC